MKRSFCPNFFNRACCRLSLVVPPFFFFLKKKEDRECRDQYIIRRENHQHHRFESSLLILYTFSTSTSFRPEHVYILTFLRTLYIILYYIYIFIYVHLSPDTACIHSRFPQTARTNLAMVHAVLSPNISFLFSFSLSLS